MVKILVALWAILAGKFWVRFWVSTLWNENYSDRLLLTRDTIRCVQTASFHAYLAPSQTGSFGQQTT